MGEDDKVQNPSNATPSTPSRTLRLHYACLITTPREPIQVLTQPDQLTRRSNIGECPSLTGIFLAAYLPAAFLPPQNPTATGPLS